MDNRLDGYEARFGMVGPLPITDGQRQPLDNEADTGPAVGLDLDEVRAKEAADRHGIRWIGAIPSSLDLL